MFCPHAVLSWPYEDLPIMDASEPFQATALASMKFDFLSKANLERKKYTLKSQAELSKQVGLYKSAFDRSKGQNAEALLVKKLEAIGLNCYELNHWKDNYIRHIDLEVSQDDNLSFTVDVEAPKALRKSRPGHSDKLSEPQDRFVCLQLGPKSTLFGGSADYLAFALTSGHFVFARRSALVECIREKMSGFLDGTKCYRSAWPETALWAPYVRSYEGHHTVMTYMDLNDLPLLGYI